MELLLTLLQVSDLHIGQIDPTTGDAAVNSAEARLFAQFPWLDGLLGHHRVALEALRRLYKQLVDDGESPRLLMTGDLTRFGNHDDYRVAESFLDRQFNFTPPFGPMLGLDDVLWRNHAIPGNHDHWPGRPVVIGGPTASFHACFPMYPYVATPIPLGSLVHGRTLKLISVNTDSDVNPASVSRIRARGKFQSQLAALAFLGARPPEEIRVLLMHHSWKHTGRNLEIDPTTRTDLGRFLAAAGIQVVLTGHLHKFKIYSFQPTPGAAEVVECRCGTTAQIDDLPTNWKPLRGTLPQRNWPKNSLIVHRLWRDDLGIRWHAEVFRRYKSPQFESISPRYQQSWRV